MSLLRTSVSVFTLSRGVVEFKRQLLLKSNICIQSIQIKELKVLLQGLLIRWISVCLSDDIYDLKMSRDLCIQQKIK